MEEQKPKIDFPISEIKYQQNIEEMTKLIPFLKEEMKGCPEDSMVFSLIEIVDFFSFKRSFNFKIKSTSFEDIPRLKQFRDAFLQNISLLDSFIVIPEQGELIPQNPNSKGSKFKSPKVYNINGDEGFIGASGDGNVIIFIYNNEKDLDIFLSKLKNNTFAIYCIGINMDFLEQKRWLKSHGYIEMKNINYYFVDSTEKEGNSTNLKFFNLPRVVLLGSDNKIIEDKCIKNIFSFDLEENLFKSVENSRNKKDQKLNTNYILLENNLKRKIVRSMNTYLKNAGLADVHFYVKSKVCIDKNGVKKTRCYPVFYGDTNKIGNNMIENLVEILNGQDLFSDIQNKINEI